MSTCKHCGRQFEPKVPYAQLCFPCWRAKKDAPKADTSVGALTLRAIKSELALSMAKDEIERLKGIITECNRRAREARPEAIPGDMLRLLLQLVHPDKHDGSQASNRATTWLLQQRAR